MIYGHARAFVSCVSRFTLSLPPSLPCVNIYRYFQIVELLVNYPEREMKDIVEETLTDEETEDPH